MTKEERKLYKLQSPETQRAMDIQAGRKVKEIVRPPMQCKKPDGSVDLNVREITQKEHDDYLLFRRKRGAIFEEVRTNYLTKMAKEGKIHISLMSQIETNHVMPPDLVTEKAQKAFMGLLSIAGIKERFKSIMETMFKPSHAEVMAEGMRKMNPK